jgi:hypothetical protein
MFDENLINGLENALRQARNNRQQLVVRLKKAIAAVAKMRKELKALDQSMNQTRLALGSLQTANQSDISSWGTESYGYDDMLDFDGDLDDIDIDVDISDDYSLQNPALVNRNPVSIVRGGEKSRSRRGGVEQVHNRFADRTITQACTLLLREHGAPLHVNELYDLLVEGGMQFTGNNPTISIAVSLNRNRRFTKVAPGTFDLMIKDASQAAS